MTPQELECHHWVREVLRVTKMRRKWKIKLDFTHYPDAVAKDEAYASATARPQYHVAVLHIDFQDPRFRMWETGPHALRYLIIHELGHVFLSPLSQYAGHWAHQGGEQAAIECLEDAEHLVIDAWMVLPLWASLRPYNP